MTNWKYLNDEKDVVHLGNINNIYGVKCGQELRGGTRVQTDEKFDCPDCLNATLDEIFGETIAKLNKAANSPRL